MTLNQAQFLKAKLQVYISEYEHIVDNEAVLEFVKQSGLKAEAYYLKTTHYFAKSEFVLEQLKKISTQLE